MDKDKLIFFENKICKAYKEKYDLCVKFYGEKNERCKYYNEMTFFFNCYNNFFHVFRPF